MKVSINWKTFELFLIKCKDYLHVHHWSGCCNMYFLDILDWTCHFIGYRRTYVCVCVCVYVCVCCLTSLSTIFQSYHDGICLMHERRNSNRVLSAATTDAPCRRHKKRDTNAPPSHIILTPSQPVLILSS